jgi:hypothetical protein
VPQGRYRVAGAAGAVVERFSCAPGPAGWRYTATREDDDGRPAGTLDLTVDLAWRALRLHAQAGGWQVRGGAAGDRVVFRRGDAEHEAVAAGFTGSSPAFAVVTARLLGLAPGGTCRVRLVRLSDALAPLTVDEGWGRTADLASDVGAVERYEVADLATGERRVVHLAGDVVVHATGVDLLSLTRR